MTHSHQLRRFVPSMLKTSGSLL